MSADKDDRPLDEWRISGKPVRCPGCEKPVAECPCYGPRVRFDRS